MKNELDYAYYLIKILISVKFNNYHHRSIREGIAEFKLNVYSHTYTYTKKYGAYKMPL